MPEVAKLIPKAVKCNRGVKEALVDMLKKTRQESLTAIAMTTVDAEGRIWTSFVGGQNYSTLLGAIARLEKRVMDEAEE